jgi:hypothetical protein
MKALTLRQPHAWAVMIGRKAVENRSWPTRYRGLLLIHSSKKHDDLPARLADRTPIQEDQLHYGAILGSVEVVDCVPLHQAPRSPFTCGPYCFLLANPRPFSTPIPYVGQVGLWTADLVASCDHCHKEQPVTFGAATILCARCGKRFPMEW